VKLLNLPGHLDSGSEAKIRESMGIDTESYRIGYKVLGESHGRVETKLLIVAFPEAEIQGHLGFFASGWPVPVAVELAGLAAINAFLSGYLENCPDESMGVVQFEDEISFFAFIHKKELVLMRKFDFGHNHMLGAIQARLNVSRETAINVAADKSFDISQIVKEVCDSFVRQVVISKHFVERRENCRVSRIFVPGATPASHRLGQEIHAASDAEIEQWDSLKAVIVPPEAVAARLAGQHSLLAASIGAGVGFFGEQSAV
jgi:Tfp pilus assembly PilM family ATPase